MFGHQDDAQQPQNDQWGSQPAVNPAAPTGDPYIAGAPTESQPAAAPAMPLIEATEQDGLPAPSPVTPADPAVQAASPSAPASDGAAADGLLDIKQHALQQLSPLVGHLDQSPEEKFRTTMMMIQASDDQNLIPVAYEAANQIADEKARAQALLDIVNEINYFTQH